MSGGQRQRVSIARALILNPSFLIADEPVSMLDVSIRAGIMNLLTRMIEERNLASICISHDLSLIRYVTEYTAVMYLGKVVEKASTENLIKKRYHPYTEALMEAVPNPDPDYKTNISKIRGEAPNPVNVPTGCRFHPRLSLIHILLPVITIFAVQAGAAIGGAVLIETVFRWPGMGREIVLAVSYRDYPLAQAAFLLIGLMTALFNLIADILYALLDPRVALS